MTAEKIKPTPITKRPTKPTKTTEITNKVNLPLAIELRYKHNLSYREIAAKMGVSHVAVQQRLTKVVKMLGDPEDNQAYDQHRQHFLTGIERQLVGQLINKKKQKAATLGNIAYAVDKVNNILRLERGQATGNQAVQITVVRFSEQPTQIDETPKPQVIDITGK